MAPKPPLPTRKPTPALLSATSKPPHKSSTAPTKRLKRESKHAFLLSRIVKTAPGSKINKRRRPAKKLVTSLDGLADALPEAPAPTSRGSVDGEGGGEVRGVGESGMKIKHKSLKSRPGAGKKKERLVAMEMERFKRNMARMAAGSGASNNVGRAREGEDVGKGGSGAAEGKGGSKERWAAIRGFISQTMERRPDEALRR